MSRSFNTRLVSALFLVATGCGVGALGGDGGGGGGGGGDGDGGHTGDPMSGNDLRDINCEATFTTVGNFELTQDQPDDVSGCWPVGVWTFTAQLDSNDCDQSPQLLPEYQFEVTLLANDDGELDQIYTYLTDPDSNHRVDVTSGGGGLCEGGLEIYSDDGKQYWNFKPALHADQSLTGFGEYFLYNSDQWN